MRGDLNIKSITRGIVGVFAAISLSIGGLTPASAVAPLGSSSLLKQTQTQNLPSIEGAHDSYGSRWFANSVVLNDRVYYTGSTAATGYELFTSDGTAAGTYAVKETISGSGTGLYVYSQKLTVSNGKIYFNANYEVWVSDGTSTGTGLLKDLSARGNAFPSQFTEVGTKTFFVATDSSSYYPDAASGTELWVTDGTSAGTNLVKDVYPGTYTDSYGTYNNNSQISNLTACGGKAYFSATDGVNGLELWVSDGTESGTNLVKNIYAGSANASPQNMSCLNGKLIFSATGTSGTELYSSDGTEAGTVLLKDIVAGSGSSSPQGMFTWNNKVFFSATDGTNGRELWSTDGTESGTSLLKNINPGNSNSAAAGYTFVEMNGRLFFAAADVRGTELWSTDGSTVGTLFVSDLNQTAPGASSNPKDFYVWNSKLYFTADNGLIGRELYSSDGSNAGTGLLLDVFPGISDMLDVSNDVRNVPFFAGTTAGLFFTANSPIYAQEMWITDGTADGTRILVDAKTGPGSSFARNYVAFNGKIFFSAASAYYGQELWYTDLTTGNTQQLIDLYPGAPSGMKSDAEHSMVVYQNRLYFSARNTTSGYELWSTDGTAEGTSLVADHFSGNNGTNASSYTGPRFLTVCNGLLFYNGSGNGSQELWKSDGTVAGTALVKELNYYVGADPRNLVCHNNTLYFSADDSYAFYPSGTTTYYGRELYTSDGTAAGTQMVTDLNSAAYTFYGAPYNITGTAHANPSNMTVVGTKLYFSATVNGETELYWLDNGLPNKVDVYSGATSSNPYNFVAYNGALYFLGSYPNSGTDMLRYDGSSITPVDVASGTGGFVYQQPVVMGGLMWFSSSGEIFTSDGTAANTGIFEDLLPGGSSNPERLVSLGGVLLYSTYDSVLGSQPRFILGEAVYNVTFNGNSSTGGTPPNTVAVMSISASVPGNTGNLVRTGYRFIGWNTSPTGVGQSYLPGSTITPIVDTPLFAQWATVTTYTVTYNSNGATGGVPAPAVAEVDTPIVLDSNSGNLVKPGYKFDGWYTNIGGVVTNYAAGFRYTASSDVIMFARWTALPAFTITFNGNGNTAGAAPSAQTGVYSTTTLPEAGTLVKTGTTFAGWNTSADGLGTAFAAGETYTPQANITLYAQWTANPTYTLTYDGNGQTTGTAPAIATASSTYVVIDSNSGSLFKSGFVFSGWNTAADGSGSTYIGGNNFLLNSNVTFYAKWVAANYTVTYSGNGNTSGTAPAAATGVSVSTVTPANSGSLVKPGYNFGGWNTLPSGLGTDYAVGATFSPSSSTTLYAKWVALPTYSIAYDGNGATSGGVPVTQSGIYASVNLDSNSGNLVKSGSYFAGWNTAADGSGTSFAAGENYTPTANVTLFALWSANPTFTLTYDGNLKTSGVPPLPQTGISSTATVLGNSGNMARIGYRFDGWNTAANGSGTNYVAGDTITLSSDTTLYPIWTTVPTYTLTYSGNGQTTGSVPLSVTTSSGSITLSANINVMTKTNFIFNGWNTAQDGTGTHFDVGAVFSLGANTTLYAEWIPQPYTVTYNANGAASGSVPNATTASGVQTVANNTGSLALPGYLFGGWNTAADGTGTTRAAGTTFTPSSNVTLFARWVTYTITYNSNGASSGSVPAARVGIDSFNISDNTGTLAKTNYFFSGWNTAANGAGTTYAVGQNFTPTANLTLYALWTSNPVYSIIYSANGATSGSAPSTSSAQAGNVTLASNNGGLARTGYTLAGWSTSANGSGTDYALGATFPLSSSVSLYAKWQPIQFLVTYSDSNAESGTAPASGSHNYGSYTISTNTGLLSRNGYVFGGWNTAADGSGTSYPEGSSLNLTSALTLYPVWTLQTFTLSYDANGASSGTVPAQVSSGLGNVAVSTNSGNLNKPGYTFKGWSVSAQNQSSVIVAGASFSLTGNTTLYAVWEAVPASSAAPSVRPEVISISQRVFPLVGGRMKLSGLNLDVLSHVTVNGQRVEILEQNEAEAEVLMPALPAGTYEFVVYAQDFVYFFAQGLSVVPDKVLTFKKVFKLNGKEDYRTKIRMLTFMSDYKKYPYVIFVTGSKYVSKFKLSKLQAQMKAVGISKRWSTTWKRTISVSQTAAKDLGRDSIRLILSYHKPS